MKCPSALVLTVNTCFSSPLLICVNCICDSFNHYGAKRQKIKYFYECSYSKIKLPLIHIFQPRYYLQTCNFLNWKNLLWNFALNVHHTLGKILFSGFEKVNIQYTYTLHSRLFDYTFELATFQNALFIAIWIEQ